MKITTIIVLFKFTLFSIFGCWLPVLAQEKEPPKLTLGVIPFQAAGVKNYEAVSLSNRLHSELVKTQQFRVVEMESVTKVLNEIGFQQAGFCTDEECAARVGNMLGAQWMVTGSVGKVGNTFTVDVRMIDVESRQVFLTSSRNHRGLIDGLLILIDGIANELALKTKSKLKTGSIEITSKPVGAYVYIDEKITGRTPFHLETIAIGDHLIELKNNGYLPWKETISIYPLQHKKVYTELKKIYQLKILSSPPYAKIYFNGKYITNTPWSGKLPEGSYTLKVSKTKYITEEKTINLTQDEQVLFELKRKEVQDMVAKLRKDRIKEQELREKKGGKGWLWAIGSAVIIGGGVAALLILKSGDKGSPSDVIGTPPDPPRNK
ncbi:PEGA domain-containing protein [candidate division KSB1 bacterium]|nr:PEGA domain-containing protein [candidate division KSB1 bacterium]